MATDRWGVTDGYQDTQGRWHPTSVATADALHAAMGADAADPADARLHPEQPLWFVRRGDTSRLVGPCQLTLEDGTDLGVLANLPPDLPLGDHQLAPRDGGLATHLVVTPPRCHLPAELRAWGWTAQLYAARSSASWGHGDLGDLATLGSMAASQGAGFVAINPLHAPRTEPTVQTSPYYPSSRVWLNPLYLRIEAVDGFLTATGSLARELRELADLGRSLNGQRLIDHERVWELKRGALDALWQQFAASPRRGRFDAWRHAQGESLMSFATFCALAEHHAAPWPEWPNAVRHPANPGVVAFAQAHEPTVAFHAWLQWLLAEQLEAASRATPLIADLAVGFDPAGADAWRWQDLLALDARVGAPPDEFNTDGQNWGTPPFVPGLLRAAHYQPWREVLDALCRPRGGLRIDHVMGLFRLYWVPPGASARDGAYVRFARNDLLDLVALASARHGTIIVGEDLGTVEDEVRTALDERHVLSTRLLWFEAEPPMRYPVRAFASIGTHDLPTVAGLLSGEDAADRARAGVCVDPADDVALRSRFKAALTGTPAADTTAPAGAVNQTARAYAALAPSPAMLVAASLDDALGAVERPNLPGTTEEQRPNWRIGLPVPIDALAAEPGVVAVAAALAGWRPRPQVTST